MSPTPVFSTLLLLLLHSQVSCEPSKEKSEASARVFEASDITAAITSLTSNYFLVKAFIIYWLHLLFQTVGWAVGSLVWNSLRPGVNSLDPDVPSALTSGLFNTEFASSNLSLGLGQWIFYFVFWTGLLFWFGLSDSSASRKSSPGTSRTDFDFSVLERAMDDLFNPNTIVKQTILNVLGAVGGSIFVGLQSYLPDSDLQLGARRETSGNHFLRSNQISEDDYFYNDYTGY